MSDEKMPVLLQNEARWDRITRVALGVALLALGVSGVIPQPYDAWLRVGSILPFATALLGWCPLYQALHIGTRRDGSSAPPPAGLFAPHPH